DVRTLIMEEAYTMKYSIRLRVNEAVARHGVHVPSTPDKDGMYIEVLERDIKVVRNTSRYDWDTYFREAEIRESKMIGLELEQETTKFNVGDHVMMKVSPWKGVIRFGKKGELAPRLIETFDLWKNQKGLWAMRPSELKA
ncbi:hypothetical protein Tco_1299550, partial [Tanacetum coccineum]